MKRLTWLLTIGLILLPAAMTMACPMCKDSIPDSDAAIPSSLPGGFNFSVYYMLAGFLACVGLVSGIITKGVRNANSQMKLPD